MPNLVEFYFDFSSPYGYIASEKIDALAARNGRLVSWRPFLLGVAFKATGGAPLPSIPIKGQYALRDIERSARFHGLGYRHPDIFPISSVTPARAFYWLDAQDPPAAKKLAQAFFRAYFLENVDISNLEQAIMVCASCGLDPEAARAGISEVGTKERTRMEVEAGLAKGVFGSPYIIVDGEPFWGADRLDQVETWLASGGF
jgi:2-hydroxychromene-2-carboxylate isomerase